MAITKQKRLLMIVERYQALHGNQPFATAAVSEWAIAQGLYPVPDRTATLEQGEKWAEKLGRTTK